MRPARAALTGHLGIGDSSPRAHPTFAAWSNMSMFAAAFTFALAGGFLCAAWNNTGQTPALVAVVAGALASASLFPSRSVRRSRRRCSRFAIWLLEPSVSLPVITANPCLCVQDDDLGVLTASFNRMQAGLAERQRLQGAFGTYVDPVLASRLLEQGDDVFAGERREVTVMFVDIRDFTPFAEASSAEDTVARLNALFEIVVPAVVDAGGHVNKFLGDGALAVFGAPNELAHHADAAAGTAVLIHRLVAEQFGGELRIGIGINTGLVIAGTIGGEPNWSSP